MQISCYKIIFSIRQITKNNPDDEKYIQSALKQFLYLQSTVVKRPAREYFCIKVEFFYLSKV